jgi:hypothetical protein
MKYYQNNKKTQYSASSATDKIIQNKAIKLEDNRPVSILQRKKNNTGLPDNLKSGIENLSGHSMDDVKVHYNSDKPAQLNAHAYAQGADIHIASGQEKHLAHEAWHVVQQKQGRVKPTLQMKGKVNINDNKDLENEADKMGNLALSHETDNNKPAQLTSYQSQTGSNSVVQRRLTINRVSKTLEEIRTWYATFPVAQGNQNGTTLPSWVIPILKYYLAPEQNYDYPLDEYNTQRKFLEEFDAGRPKVKVGKKTIPRPGKIDKKNIKSMNQWSLGDSNVHTAAAVDGDVTVLAHNAWDHKHFDQKTVDPNYGANPGEFGKGFYLTTGHEVEPQNAVRDKWTTKTGQSPREIIKFSFRNRDIQTNILGYPAENMSVNQTAAYNLVIYMLQHSTGYPDGMSDATALTIMNRVNLEGKVLLFPMDKTVAVTVSGGKNESWDTYTQNNQGDSSHLLVIGPQRPPELAGIRQITFRGDVGDLEINRAQRSRQTAAPPSPEVIAAVQGH